LLSWDSITQAMGGETDRASFSFGNADRVMRDLAADTNLDGARIEFSLYHVETEIKLTIWVGYVVEFEGDSEDEFTISAQDGLPLNLIYPMRRVSRTCWKPFNDGVNCIPPVTSLPCDHTLEGESGCRVHDNIRQFGGHITKPQSVRVKDNSTGTWGLGRLILNATSLVNDSVDGTPLPEIYTDTPIPVAGLIAAARDEGDFYDALVIAGEGPIGLSENIFDHRLNGSPPHGTRDQALAGLVLGYRGSNGPDPEAVEGSDSFPPGADHWFMLTETSGPPAEGTEIFAAGTAFAEIRISDQPGLQLKRATDNEAVLVVNGGLGGWYWENTSEGPERLHSTNLTNPIWVALNTIFRAKFLKNSPAVDQEDFVYLDSATASAAVCADEVPTLIGEGTETQFKFVGVLGSLKPLRDWLSDILATCLGYYTWVAGKIYIGMRIHSGVEEGKAFSTGNVIDGSLKLKQRVPDYNHLTVEFDEPNPEQPESDRARDFTRTTIVAEDQDHINLYGLKAAQISLNGVVNRSQALRVGATMLREQLGGVNEAEWKAARSITFRTTVLAIGIQAGDVCSLSHPDMPDGVLGDTPTPDYGEFRITRWRLYPDMSLELEGETTTDSMYDLVVGPKPVDVGPDPLPLERIEEILPFQPWFPDQESPGVDDPLYDETDRVFLVQQQYDAQGNARLSIVGDHPTTKTVGEPPRIKTVTTATTGGSIPGASYIVVCLSAIDGAGMETRVSKPIGVQVGPSGNSHTITLSGITWPPDTVGYRLYAAIDHQQMCRQDEASSEQPSSVTLTSVANVRTQGVPQENLTGLIARAKKCWHAGVTGQQITEVDSSGGILVLGAGWQEDEWAGRYVLVLADESDGSAPPLVFEITGNTEDTLNVTPDPVAAGVEAGDAITIMTSATDFGPTSIGDEMFQNAQFPDGMNPGEEVGRIVKIIRGTGEGQERLVSGNTQTVLTVTPAWRIEPDATSVFIVLAASWEYESAMLDLSIEQGETVEITLPVDNLLRETLYVEVATVDRWGHEPQRRYNPWRLIYLYGTLGLGVRDWWAVINDPKTPLVTGEDLAVHRPVGAEEGEKIELLEWYGALTVAPDSGGSVTVDIQVSYDDGDTWESIFPSDLPTFVAGDRRIVGSDFNLQYLYRDGMLRYDLVATDGTAAILAFVLAGRRVAE